MLFLHWFYDSLSLRTVCFVVLVLYRPLLCFYHIPNDNVLNFDTHSEWGVGGAPCGPRLCALCLSYPSPSPPGVKNTRAPIQESQHLPIGQKEKERAAVGGKWC